MHGANDAEASSLSAFSKARLEGEHSRSDGGSRTVFRASTTALVLLLATWTAARAHAQPGIGSGGDSETEHSADVEATVESGEDAADSDSSVGDLAGGPREPTSNASEAPLDERRGAASSERALEVPTADCASADPPPFPTAEDHPDRDWVLTASDERFGGSVVRMRDGTLRFESDELGNVNIDWTDVVAYRSTDVAAYVTTNLATHVGTARMNPGGPLVIATGEGPVELRSESVESIVMGKDELDHWKFTTDLGLNLVLGTIDQASFGSNTRLTREDALTRFELIHAASYGLTEGTEAVNHQWGTAELQVLLSGRFFASAIQVNLGYDLFQNIAFRGSAGAGVGYEILQGGPEWTISLLGLYQYTAFDEVEPGRAAESQGAGPGIDTRFEWDVIGEDRLHVIFTHRTRIVISRQGLESSNFRTSLGLSSELTSHLDVNVTGTWDRVLDPEPLQDGTNPQADTFTVVVGLGLHLGE